MDFRGQGMRSRSALTRFSGAVTLSVLDLAVETLQPPVLRGRVHRGRSHPVEGPIRDRVLLQILLQRAVRLLR